MTQKVRFVSQEEKTECSLQRP